MPYTGGLSIVRDDVDAIVKTLGDIYQGHGEGLENIWGGIADVESLVYGVMLNLWEIVGLLESATLGVYQCFYKLDLLNFDENGRLQVTTE